MDETTFRADPPLPSCKHCGGLARPNILMFGDYGWLPDRSARQRRSLEGWLQDIGDASLAIVEMGAGSGVPTVRMTSESLAARHGATLIRINPREAHGPPGQIGIAAPALEALRAIDARLGREA